MCKSLESNDGPKLFVVLLFLFLRIPLLEISLAIISNSKVSITCGTSGTTTLYEVCERFFFFTNYIVTETIAPFEIVSLKKLIPLR